MPSPAASGDAEPARDVEPGVAIAPPDSGEFGSRYAIVHPLAEGGLGRLWIVHDRDLHRDVILKELRAEQADHPHARRWLIKEGQIASQLEHRNIIPVYDLGARSGTGPSTP